MIHGLETAVVSQLSHPAPEHWALAAAEPRVIGAALPLAGGTAPVPDPHGLAQGAHRHMLTTSRAASLLQILLFTFFGPMKHCKYPAVEQSSCRQGRL